MLALPEVAIADWRLVLIGLVVLCYCFLVAYFTGQSYQLRHIPTSSSNAPLVSYLGAIWYTFAGKAFIDDSFKRWPKKMFRVPGLVQWTVIASDREVIAELLRSPETTFSASDSAAELIQLKYTLNTAITSHPYHFRILQNQLRRAIPQLVPEIYEEMTAAFKEHLPVTDGEWTPIKFSEIIPKVLCRASNRVFVGYPLCRDPGFLDLSVRFTLDLVKTALLLRSFPAYLRPLLNSIVSAVPRHKRKALKYLGPIFDARRSIVHNDEGQKPLDMITWLMDAATGEETTNEALTDRMLAINFAAIHTSSMTFTHAIYYLASCPTYAQPLREEVDAIIQVHGWSKAGLDLMVKVDSFIRESQRMRPLLNVGLARVAREDYTFSDGTYIPRGTTVAVNLHSPHSDETIYEHSGTFNPERFIEAKEEKSDADAGKSRPRGSDMTTTSNKFLAFGSGRHSCPGRFLAASQQKLMMAHVLMNYDLKFEQEGVRPADLWRLSSCIPNPNAKVLVRKRDV